MAFCSSCGKGVPDGSAFCSSCGAPLLGESPKARSDRTERYAGPIYKCPSCGEALGALSGTCPACGYELRGVQASQVVRQFAEELTMLDGEAGFASEGGKKGKAEPLQNQGDKKAAALIRNFVVPNTKEDIFEFMIFAQSRIRIYDGASDANKDVLEAWAIKAEQAYQKGRLIMPASDGDFARLEKLYESIQEELACRRGESSRQIKEQARRGFIGIVVGIVVAIAATIIDLAGSNASLVEVLAVVILCVATPIAQCKGRSVFGIICGVAAGLICFVLSRIIVANGGNGSVLMLQCIICVCIAIYGFFRFIKQRPNS